MDASEFCIVVTQQGKHQCLLTPHGRLDYTHCDQFLNAILAQIQSGITALTIDLKHLDHLSSSGVSIFLEAVATARENGAAICFVNPSPQAMDVFRLLGVLLDSCDLG